MRLLENGLRPVLQDSRSGNGQILLHAQRLDWADKARIHRLFLGVAPLDTTPHSNRDNIGGVRYFLERGSHVEEWNLRAPVYTTKPQ
jgi:hypothetical protein